MVISTPRSGSTLLACLLDATGGISMLKEAGFHPRSTGVPPPRVLKTWAQRSLYLQSLWQAFPPATYPEARRAICEIVAEHPMKALPIADVWRRYGRRVAELRGRRMWGHTNPHSPGWWRQEMALMPESHAVILLREPFTVAASLFGRDWGVLWRGGPYPPEVRAAAAALIVRNLVRPLAEAIDELPPDRRTVVRYEDLADSPDTTLDSLSPIVGQMDWSAAVRDYRETPIARRETSEGDHHDSLRGPIDRSVALRWTTDMAPGHVSILHSVLAGSARRLGYPPSDTSVLTGTETEAIRRAERTLRWLQGTRRAKEQIGGNAKWFLSSIPTKIPRVILRDRSPSANEWQQRRTFVEPR